MNTKPRLLIAEKDDLLREMLCLMLQRTRPLFQITAVRNGQDAYTHYQQHGADVIITDNRMPMMTGTSLIHTLRAEGDRVPIMLLSSVKASRDAIRGDPDTIVAAKPVLMPDMLLLIDMLLVG